MSSSKYVKESLVVSATSTTDFSDAVGGYDTHVGVFVKLNATQTVAAPVNVDPVAAATDVPFGVLVSTGAAGMPLGVALDGPIVRVRTGATPGAITVGSNLMLNDDGTVALDPGTGTGVVTVAVALEKGTNSAGELLMARLIKPVSR